MNNEEKIKKFSDTVVDAVNGSRFINLTFSSFPRGEIKKVKGIAKCVSGETKLQLEYYLSEGRVRHENIASGGIYDAIRINLSNGAKNCQLVCSNGTATLMVSSKGAVNTTYKLDKTLNSLFPVISGNNRDKNYIFTGREGFLIELGISNKDGRVHDKKQSKFRQINRFAEQVRDIIKYLPKEGTLLIYDLCCGKSYLSFAVYSYLTENLGRNVDMICVDLKVSVIEYCRSVANKLGYSGMKFLIGDITQLVSERRPDLVISLHACDTATDIVIDFAIRSKAKVLLSTPCCQHEMFNIMNCPELEFISKYSILKQKIASAATDALRLSLLESNGYKTDAIELIDPDETPKNVLLRGILMSASKDNEPGSVYLSDKYKKYYTFMTGVSPESD